MKTIARIASEIGIDKQKLYRHIKKNNIKESHQNGEAMYYDEVIETQIKQFFSRNATSNESHQYTSESHQNTSNDVVIQALIKQLEVKDKQIDELTATIKILSESIKAAHHNELAETIIDSQSSLTSPKKKSFWNRIFKKNK
jgi:hypothetical protein